MSQRTREWMGRLGTGVAILGLLVLTGCYASARTPAYYSTGYVAPAQQVYYQPAQVQVQTQPVYYEAQPAYYPPQGTVYVQPAAPPPVYYAPPTVYIQGGVRGHHGHHGHRGHRGHGGWQQQPVQVQQGDGVPGRVEVRPATPAPSGTVIVR